MNSLVRRPPLHEQFWLPSREQLLAAHPGCFVKLAFNTDAGLPNERLWVELTEVGEEVWKGTIGNAPIFVPLSFGDPIEFHPLDVIDIQPPDVPKYPLYPVETVNEPT